MISIALRRTASKTWLLPIIMTTLFLLGIYLKGIDLQWQYGALAFCISWTAVLLVRGPLEYHALKNESKQ